MRRLLLVLALGLLACQEPTDGPCEAGEVRCPTTRTIQYCLDGVWQDEEDCAPREAAGGLEITTYCYVDQGVCAP